MIQIIGDFELKIRYKTKISYKYKDLKDYKNIQNEIEFCKRMFRLEKRSGIFYLPICTPLSHTSISFWCSSFLSLLIDLDYLIYKVKY